MSTTEEKLIKDPAAEAGGDSLKGNLDPKLQETVNNLKRPAPAEADADESPEAKAARSVRQLKRKRVRREKSREQLGRERERKNMNSSSARGGYFAQIEIECN